MKTEQTIEEERQEANTYPEPREFTTQTKLAVRINTSEMAGRLYLMVDDEMYPLTTTDAKQLASKLNAFAKAKDEFDAERR